MQFDMPQFLISHPAQHGDLVRLSSDEAHHLRDVFRKQVGERVLLTDGRGTHYRGTIERLGKKEVTLLIEEVLPAAEPRTTLIVGQALLKGDKMEWVIQKAVELGVDTLIPFFSSRTIAAWNKPDKIRRWEKIIREATKQCGRSTLMSLDLPVPFEKILKSRGADLKLVFWEEAKEGCRSVLQGFSGKTVLALIGPEGGFSASEISLAQKENFLPLSLGSQTLRAETAAIVSMGLIQYELENI